MKLIKENIPFTMVANEVLQDKNLSLKAKGMYSYLFSKPDEWDFSSNRMILETNDGRKSVMNALKELEQEGYLVRNRLPSGKMEYVLKYTSKSLSAESGLRVEKPKFPLGTVPKRLSAQSSPISNTDAISNTDTEVRRIATGMSATADAFNTFWERYPKKEQKKKAQDIWKRKKLDSSLPVILEFIEKASASDRWKKGFIKMPTSFLSGECWTDDLSSYGDFTKETRGALILS
jgi:DNA-binding MarR family transcriptional regulator